MADSDLQYTDKPRHPKFDEYWEEHKGLVWHMAKRLSPVFHVHYRELIGTLTQRFNYCLHYFDESRGKFSSFFCRHALREVLVIWMRRESQSWDNFVSQIHKQPADRELSERNFAQHEVDFHLYRVPEEDQSDIDQIIDFFEGADECWEFMTRHMDRTDKEILELHWRQNWTLVQVAEKFKVSKQRVCQRQQRAKEHIHNRIKQVSALADLFAHPKMEDE